MMDGDGLKCSEHLSSSNGATVQAGLQSLEILALILGQTNSHHFKFKGRKLVYILFSFLSIGNNVYSSRRCISFLC